MMKGRLFVLQIGLIVPLFLVLNMDLNEAIIFRFTNAPCESVNKSWVVYHTCRLKAVARNKAVFNMNATVLVPVKRILIRVEILKKANGYKPWLFNATIDGCKFQENNYNPFFILIFKQFRDFSNMNHTCPYVGPQIVKGLYLRHELLNNLPVPTGEYYIRITWYFNGKHVAYTNLYFEYVEDL